jgi:hypothetical protein
MAMDHQHRSPSSPGAAFACLMQTYARPAQRYADLLMQRSKFLSSPDQDDIYALGMTKIWYAYFRPNARQQYHYRDPNAEFRLIKLALRSVANDLIVQRRRERVSFQLLELDALEGESDDLDRFCASDDFAGSINLKLDLERSLNQQLASSTLGPVALYLSGHASRAQVGHYSAGNLRTNESRLRQKLKAFLREQRSANDW